MYDRSCELFVDFEGSEEMLVALLSSLVDGSVAGSDVSGPWCEMSIDRNMWFEAHATTADNTEFLKFRYDVELDINDRIDRPTAVEKLGRLLKSMWSLGVPAVVACDFEDDLPRKGGYNPHR